MSKRLYFLVEGQTEENFVKTVLTTHFPTRDLRATILNTKRVKDGPNFKGGVTQFSKFEQDLKLLLSGAGQDALVTTIVDYYGLPEDFPGMSTRPQGTAAEKVQHIEESLKIHFDDKRFLPFVVLHEFEAWLFSSTEVLPRIMTEPQKQQDFTAIRIHVNSPEDINDNPETAPSKRILGLFPRYNKPVYGPSVLEQIGLDRVRQECPHFNWWLSELERFFK